jgi:hypothetical protein
VAANVLLDARTHYRHHRLVEAPAPVRVNQVRAEPMMSAEDVLMATFGLLDELHAAERAGVITSIARARIIRTRIDGEPLAVVAADHHTTAQPPPLRPACGGGRNGGCVPPWRRPADR